MQHLNLECLHVEKAFIIYRSCCRDFKEYRVSQRWQCNKRKVNIKFRCRVFSEMYHLTQHCIRDIRRNLLSRTKFYRISKSEQFRFQFGEMGKSGKGPVCHSTNQSSQTETKTNLSVCPQPIDFFCFFSAFLYLFVSKLKVGRHGQFFSPPTVL